MKASLTNETSVSIPAVANIINNRLLVNLYPCTYQLEELSFQFSEQFVELLKNEYRGRLTSIYMKVNGKTELLDVNVL